MTNSPIADLSYRNYDGPLDSLKSRWWPIAKMSMRLSIKQKGFWIWSVLSSWFYIIAMAAFYITTLQLQSFAGSDGKNPLLSNIKWGDQFVTGFSFSQLLLFVIALLIGAGSIANDNKANALLVYLSRPITKVDYLIGKWLGIAIPISLVSFIPMLIFYAYCGMSYQDYGIFADKWLLAKLILLALVPGVVYASLCVGISSLFNQPRLAVATIAGVYFLTNFFTYMVIGIWISTDRPNTGVIPFLTYASVDGLQIGAAKVIFHTQGSNMLNPGKMRNEVMQPGAFPLFFTLTILCVLMVLLAWQKIRPVEIIGGK